VIPAKKVLMPLLAACSLWGLLLVTDRKVLIWETTVRPGQALAVSGWGDVDGGATGSLVCRYFTGRSVVTRVFTFAANNLLGRDQCPFMLSGRD
jgi:hypothetical protein